jgi:hypothetical protein
MIQRRETMAALFIVTTGCFAAAIVALTYADEAGR